MAAAIAQDQASAQAAPPKPAPMLEVRGLAKSFGELEVLRGVDFELERGESLVVLGRSGCGKSVTLRLLNGLDAPDSGHIFFDGDELTGLPEAELYPYRRRMAMLFQSGALFDSLDVGENIALPLRERNKLRRKLRGHARLSEDQIAAAVREQLDRVRLGDVERSMPSDLSGGMRKRVALARALVTSPELMLYDEPTTGLDPVTSAVIGELIQSGRRDVGASAVVVTHDLPLARAVGDRLAFLDGGRLRFLGTWSEADASDDPVLRGFLEGKADLYDDQDLADQDLDDQDLGDQDSGDTEGLGDAA